MQDPISCAACGREMIEVNFGSAMVDVCSSGCQGIWFDSEELSKVDHSAKGLGPALERALSEEGARTSTPNLLDCPRCHSAMRRESHALVPEVNVYTCGSCDGAFLEGGQLARLRARSATPEEIEEAKARRLNFDHRRAERQLKKGTWFNRPYTLLDVLIAGLNF